MKNSKFKNSYILQLIIDFGPPTLISIFWALYSAYQDDGFIWEVFIKNFLPAFLVLNWLSIRLIRTKRQVEKKNNSKIAGAKFDEIKMQLDRIEEKLAKAAKLKDKEE